MVGQSENARTYEIPWPRLRGVGEDGRPCERAHGPRLDRRKGLEMSKNRRKNQFKEVLDAKREALASAAKQPKPEPEWEPETPELRAEVLADCLAERDAELAKEQGRRG